MTPKISIIIPVFNTELYIHYCLKSAVNHIFKEIEIIVINDASTDKFLELIKKFAESDSRLRLIDIHENKGPGFCRNIGIKEARGDYILFLDSDDWLNKEAAKLVYNKVKSNNYQIVVFGHSNRLMSGTKKTRKTRTFLPTLKEDDTEFFHYAMLTTKGLRPMPWGYLFARKFLIDNKILFAEDIYFEDVVFTTKAWHYASRVGFIKQSLYNYRVRKKSIARSASKKKIDDCFTAHLEIKKFLEKQGVYEKYKKEYTVRFLSCCLALCFTYYLMMPKKERDNELISFMDKSRKSYMLHSSNLQLLKNIFVNNSTDEVTEHIFFKNAYNFLSTIKYNYRFALFAFYLKRLLRSVSSITSAVYK